VVETIPTYIEGDRQMNTRRTRVLTGVAIGVLISTAAQAGVVPEYPLPSPNSYPLGIVSGADGNLWFTEGLGNNIGRITPSGIITEFALIA
jgi:streptogramin lyase